MRQQWVNWIPWENCSVPACDLGERATQRAAPLEWYIHTAHRRTTLELTGMEREPQPSLVSQGPSRRSRVAARQVGLAGKNTTFQCYLWRCSRGSTGHLRDLAPDTCPSHRVQLTARIHLVLGVRMNQENATAALQSPAASAE